MDSSKTKDYINKAKEIAFEMTKCKTSHTIDILIEQLNKLKEENDENYKIETLIDEVADGFDDEFKSSITVQELIIDEQNIDSDGDSYHVTSIKYFTSKYNLTFYQLIYDSPRIECSQFDILISSDVGSIKLEEQFTYYVTINKESFREALAFIGIEEHFDNIYNAIACRVDMDEPSDAQEWYFMRGNHI